MRIRRNIATAGPAAVAAAPARSVLRASGTASARNALAVLVLRAGPRGTNVGDHPVARGLYRTGQGDFQLDLVPERGCLLRRQAGKQRPGFLPRLPIDDVLSRCAEPLRSGVEDHPGELSELFGAVWMLGDPERQVTARAAASSKIACATAISCKCQASCQARAYNSITASHRSATSVTSALVPMPFRARRTTRRIRR